MCIKLIASFYISKRHNIVFERCLGMLHFCLQTLQLNYTSLMELSKMSDFCQHTEPYLFVAMKEANNKQILVILYFYPDF